MGAGLRCWALSYLGILCGGMSAALFKFWRQRGPWDVRHDEHRTLVFVSILLLYRGVACLTFGRPGYNVTDIYVS